MLCTSSIAPFINKVRTNIRRDYLFTSEPLSIKCDGARFMGGSFPETKTETDVQDVLYPIVASLLYPDIAKQE